MYDATPYIKFGEENLVAVRVDHSQSADSRWYTGSGIYRNVWVVYANPVHVEQWGVYAYPEKLKKGFQLNIEVNIENGLSESSALTIKNELFDKNNKLIGKSSEKLTVEGSQSGKINTVIKVANPELWSLTNPVLYSLKTSVFQNDQLIDETNTITGFRNFTFDPNKGFAL